MKIAIPVSKSKTQFFLNQAYVDYVIGAGYTPVAVYPGMKSVAVAKECNGLLLPGGIDIDPIYYGYDNHNSYSTEPKKDAFERELLYAFKKAGKPIFGICRGFQLIAREYLDEHDKALVRTNLMWFAEHVNDHAQTSDQSTARDIPSHWIYTTSPLYDDLKDTEPSMPVNSMHHQCLMANWPEPGMFMADGLRVVAWTNRGIKIGKNNKHQMLVEALVIEGWGAPVKAVQWHPEELKDYDLIKSFFDKYGKPRKRKTS